MVKTLQAVKFLFVGPVILAFLFVVDWMTSPGDCTVEAARQAMDRASAASGR